MTIQRVVNGERYSSSNRGRIIDVNSMRMYLQTCLIMRESYSYLVPRYCILDFGSLPLIFRKIIFVKLLETGSNISNFTFFDEPPSCCLQLIISQYLINFLHSDFLSFVGSISSIRYPYFGYTNLIHRIDYTGIMLPTKVLISNPNIKRSFIWVFQLLLNLVNLIKHIFIGISGAYFLSYHRYINWKKAIMLTQKKLPLSINYQTPLVFMFSTDKSIKRDETDDGVDCSHEIKKHIKNGKNSNKTKNNNAIFKETSSTRKQGDRPLRKFSTKSKSNSCTPIYSTDDNVTSQTSLTTNLSTGPPMKQNFLPRSSTSSVFMNKQKKKSKFYHAPTPVKRHTSSQKLSELQAEFLESVQYSTSIDLTLSSRYGSLDTCSIAMENVSNSKRNLNDNPWDKES